MTLVSGLLPPLQHNGPRISGPAQGVSIVHFNPIQRRGKRRGGFLNGRLECLNELGRT